MQFGLSDWRRGLFQRRIFESYDMRVLEVEEVQLVSGGDSWAGTAAGRASVSPYSDCVIEGFGRDNEGGSAGGIMLYCLKVFF